MNWRMLLIGAALMPLFGCGSSPKTDFFALDAVAPAQPAKGQAAFPVQVAAVHVPASLDRREMVRKNGETVDISDTERWTAPLGDMVRNVLSQDLENRLPQGKVVLPDAPAPDGTASIVVNIAEFAPEASGKVELKGSWSLLKDGKRAPALTRDVAIEAPAGKGGAAAAKAMSEAVGRLAANIASELAVAG